MNTNIQYIVAGGPLHGRTYDCLPTDDSIVETQAAANSTAEAATLINATRQHPHGGSLRIAAKRRLGNGGVVRYIVLHPQATGEQFLTILAA